jgi:uncharacterized repeat protein (TIGR03806 family)
MQDGSCFMVDGFALGAAARDGGLFGVILAGLLLGATNHAAAQANHAMVPFVPAQVTIDGVFSPGEWDGALVIPVDGLNPQQNPGWNPLNGQPIELADLSYNLLLMHDGVYFHVAFDVTDNNVSDDYTATRPDHTEVWNDDCTEVFIDGDLDRDVTESTPGSPVGDRDWREGMQPHFGVRGQSHWENNSGYKDKTWWAATTRTAQGYRTEYRFAFRGIDTADGEANFEPLKIGDTIGFSALVNDDDFGGNRENQLAWIGGGTDDSLFRSQWNWGYATMLPPAGFGPPAIPTRVENEVILIDTVPDLDPGALVSQRVFPRLNFEKPLLLIESPDNSGRLFVVEQRGRLRSFLKSADPDPASVTTFLDIASRARSPLEGGGGLEEGLLGLAFDPDFATNGHLYVYYSVRNNPRRTRVSRFTANPASAATVNPDTEQILLEIPQPDATHNAGMIAFGPDGMLYIGTGDGGGVGDNAGEGNNAQNTTNLLGSMLRIDVRSTPDQGLAYRIPPDNPFFATGPAGTNTRREIWAYGLRNPWRWSFDAQTGALLLADVGQGAYEEINVIKRGANYGWRIMEGANCYNSANCNQQGLTLPIAGYTHDFGLSVTGGFVYYGPDVPTLYGKYVYGDYVSGRLWALTYDPATDTTTPPVQVAVLSGFELGAFGQDQSGELYLLNLANGGIFVLRPGTPTNPVNPVTTDPAPPVRGQNVTVTYNATNRNLEGRSPINLYSGINGWSGVTTRQMNDLGQNRHSVTFQVPANATVLNMVFNHQAETWDNNGGQDWNINTVADGGAGGSVVATEPAPPVRGQTVTITYDATGRVLAGAQNVNIHRGINGWTGITTQAMTSLGDNRHRITFTVPGNATVLDFAFNNGTGTWDNNGGQDWHINTVSAKSAMIAELLQACEGTRPFPTRLSDIPALLNAGKGIDQVNLGIIPYEPSAKLWSDGTEKERFIALPGLETIGYRENSGWDFPDGTTLIKNFVLPLDERHPTISLKRVETRLMVRYCGEWYGFSYEWNEAETDAQLLTTSKQRDFTIIEANGAALQYQWHYPSRAQCSICHTAASNHVLGLTTAQINHDLLYPRSGVVQNQLKALDYISLFGESGLPGPPETLPKMPDPFDLNYPVRDRARAYLAANCASCHQPGGGGGGLLDLRWHVADESTGMIDAQPGNTLGIPNARVVAPGDPSRSVLYQRMISLHQGVRMPPLATSRVDEDGAAVIRSWIETLGGQGNPTLWGVY